ncbi:iron chaperone [Kytococcus schroeteri]|uniref:iron chaperone n=1 Tax=Kytococcus schroeteri TaxID=138300 RepID=UPI0035E5FEF2
MARLRGLVHDWYPGARETISYRMPTFEVEGHRIGGVLSHRDFLSWYPHSGTTLTTLADGLGDRSRTKSALHFTVEDPLPEELFERLLATRRAEWH